MSPTGSDAETTVAIVGAGMSGLCIAARLKQSGINDFVILEKADAVGGTWRENSYPGLACDIPAHNYAYSFALKADWSSLFGTGPEIRQYFECVADQLDLREHIRFNAEVVSARWDGDVWELLTGHRGNLRARFLVAATGFLHHPRTPELPGLTDFGGQAFHSARWDHDAQIDGRRVAVVGTGASGAQIVTALPERASRVLLFQRTPQWILPVPNLRYPKWVVNALKRFPTLTVAYFRTLRWFLEGVIGPAPVRPCWQRRVLGMACRLNLRYGLRNPDLRAKLTPRDDPFCKRLVMSSKFYGAVQHATVDLITDAIDHVEAGGVVTEDGTLHEADVLVLATGFEAHSYMRPMEIVGVDGRTLADEWANGPRAYRTVALPGFPNLFMMVGPHSPIGNHSVIAVAETQANWIVRCIQRMSKEGIASIEPTAGATERFNQELRDAMPATAWTSGCRSWYIAPDGTPDVWPWVPQHHRKLLREPDFADFAVTGAGGP